MAIRAHIGIASFALSLFVLILSSTAQETDTNTNIVRSASGVHSFYAEDGSTLRGREHFRLMAHGDGSRTMILTKDMFDVDRHYNIVMHVDAAYRPLDVFASYWQQDGFKGSIRVTVDNGQLHAASWGPGGRTEHEMQVPDDIAVITHGEGLNGWNASVADADDSHSGGPVEMIRTSYFISPVRNVPGPVLGSLTTTRFSRVGEETVTVPAGTFETIHYSSDAMDVWAMKGDRVMVRQIFANREYVLTEYSAD